MHSRINESIFLSPVTPVEIEKMLLTLKDSATGWDEINAMFLKTSLNYIRDPLCHVCNMSLEEGIFPSKLKIANVLPLFKAEEPSHFNNYRPVSLLCILSKVFEKIMYNRVSDFINKLELLHKFQFGFRKKHSTYLAHLILMDKITKSLDNGDKVIGIYLDFSKAFDTVNHDILLQNCITMESEVTHMNGLKVIWQTGSSMWLTMVYSHLPRRYNVVFLKGPF